MACTYLSPRSRNSWSRPWLCRDSLEAGAARCRHAPYTRLSAGHPAPIEPPGVPRDARPARAHLSDTVDADRYPPTRKPSSAYSLGSTGGGSAGGGSTGGCSGGGSGLGGGTGGAGGGAGGGPALGGSFPRGLAIPGLFIAASAASRCARVGSFSSRGLSRFSKIMFTGAISFVFFSFSLPSSAAFSLSPDPASACIRRSRSSIVDFLLST